MATALLERFASAYDPARPSLRIAAQTLASALDIAVDRARVGGNCPGLASFITALAIGASPLVPATAASLWLLIGNTGPLAWPAENPMPARRANDIRQQVLS
jgi:hypothetical protein